jgi:hypothetical protein
VLASRSIHSQDDDKRPSGDSRCGVNFGSRADIVGQVAEPFFPLRAKTNFLSRINVICPVQPLPQKYSCFQKWKSPYIHPCPAHLRGVSRTSRTRVGMRWTRQRRARYVMQGGLKETRERSNGSLTNDAQPRRSLWRRRVLRTAKTYGPDIPTLMSSLSEAKSAQPGADQPYP